MRLSIISSNYAPEPTGIGFYNTDMARWLQGRLGWSVTVHTGIPHYPWWRVPAPYAGRDFRHGRADEILDGVRVERVRHHVPTPPVGGLARMRLDASFLGAWFQRGLARRPTVIMAVAPPFLSGLLALFLGWRLRVPVVYHVQDLQVDAARELGMLPTSVTRLLASIERFILARVDLVTTVSPAMRACIQGKVRTRRPVALFPNWADTGRMRPWTGENGYRKAWGLTGSDVVIMYSGNLGRKQGVEVLLAAAAMLGSSPHVVIAGEGAERAELERLAQSMALPRLRFLGLAPGDRLDEFLSAADIHCIPQRRAAAGLVMPSKLLNIMAVARPVVVTADAGTDLARAISQADCGIVAEPERPEHLAEALERLIRDPAMRDRMGRAGRRHVEAELAIAPILGTFAQRLTALGDRSRPASHRSVRQVRP